MHLFGFIIRMYHDALMSNTQSTFLRKLLVLLVETTWKLRKNAELYEDITGIPHSHIGPQAARKVYCNFF